jgi:hypothetical protein
MPTATTDLKTIAELKRLAIENGGLLMPERVVASASAVTSPLHRYFTWDNSEAAEKYRLYEARQLINVCVEYLGGDVDSPVRVFVSLREDRGQGGYRTLAEVLRSPSKRDALLADAIEEMKYFRDKYKSLKELVEVFKAMSAAERRLSSKK